MELQAEKPGGKAVTHKLAEILFVQIIRHYAIKSGNNSGYLVALVDPNIGIALSLIHEMPENQWRLEELARQSGISRTAFITKFSKLVGVTPIQYLTQWRLLKSKELLSSTDLSIWAICQKSGYTSEASFSRAFKKAFGLSPGELRRQRG